MQRRSGAKYIRSGIPGHSAPGGKPASPIPAIMRALTMAAAIIAFVLVLVYIGNSLFGGGGQPILINANPTDNIRPFGDSLLHYDGMALRCLGPNGARKWEFTLGVGADFYCTKDRVIAWVGNQVHVLDKNGAATFNDRLSGEIRFARVGQTYIAAVVGETELHTQIQVFNHDGMMLENIEKDVEDLYVMDAGFFTQRGQHMWVLSLDVNGNQPISTLRTYEPGRMTTGSVELDNELVYKIYTFGNDLMVVNTTKVQAYSYKCVERVDIPPVLTYGWLVRHVRQIGRTTYALLEQMPTAGDDMAVFSELRLVTDSTMSTLRLLSPCLASGLSEKGVYGFSESIIYYAPYGQTLFRTFPHNYRITGLICMLDNGRAVVVTAGNEVRILTLPT